MPNEKRLPLRVVQPSRDFLHKDERKGGSVKSFITDETEFKSHQDFLSKKIYAIERGIEDNFEKYPEMPSVIKAKLREDAWAKSHRPIELFKMDTCPIIGLDRMGEILISATKTGLDKLKSRIRNPTTKVQKANISAVENIKEFKDKLLGLTLKELMEKSKRDDRNIFKAILFDHHDQKINDDIKYTFLSWAKKERLEVRDISKLKGLSIWSVAGASEDQVKEMTAHPSVRTVSFFPSFRIILEKGLISNQEISNFPAPDDKKEYPKIAVIDGGVPKSHLFLSPWVIDRDSYIPDPYQNNKHGCFVGGLISMGSQLNGKRICPDNEPIQIVDIPMIPEPNKDTVTEDILIEWLKTCVPKITNKHKIRVWNMSAGLDLNAEDERFSSLAIVMDKLQDENNIIMTLPSGNYEDPLNQRTWPPQDLGDANRLQVPADSVRAMTVGAITCKEKPDSIVKINQPASYSRKGPGPTYITKPELVHYSGNLTVDNGLIDYSNQGILSFDEKGNIVEEIGTSYSCALAARTMSIIHNRLMDPTTSNMIKALTVHNSNTPGDLGKTEDVFHYVGFGKPEKVDEMLSCKESEITLMFEQGIYEGYNLIYPLPWPKSLINEEGKCRGKVRMTLVAGVPLDSRYGSEYVRANVSASLQAGSSDKNGKMNYSSKLHDDPDTSDLSKCYEKEIIKHAYKWKPIKRYERHFKGVKAEEWRVKVSMLLREGLKLGAKQIKFALVLSLIDPEGVAPVYDEMIVGLRSKNVITNPIQLRDRIKKKVKRQDSYLSQKKSSTINAPTHTKPHSTKTNL